MLANGIVYPAIILDPRIIGYRASEILLLRVEPRYFRSIPSLGNPS